ncbi:MAG TPA: hypothetical protein VFS67_15090 [Polyangiaceae bacterium]|nr:hypothetical protein [Polyangiaceae bacterium]
MNAEIDPTLLAELRELHQSERAPAELERSVLERLSPARQAAPLGARLRAWWNRASSGRVALGATLGMATLGALYLGVRALSVEPARELWPEPVREAAGKLRGAAQCPLGALPPGFAAEAMRLGPEAAAAGLTLDTFAMPIAGCPELVRRTLSYVPPGLTSSGRAVVIVLHDGGQSAESVRALQTQNSFEVLAARERFILVYANAAPALGHLPNSGVWQSDPDANGGIDDFAYLARIVERLQKRRLLDNSRAASPDVYLVGYGSGARMALEAAARYPGRYAGVAALLPDKINAFRPPPRRAGARLSRLFFVTVQDARPWAYWPGVPLDVATIDEWAVAVGLPRMAFQQGLEPEPGLGDQSALLANAMSTASAVLRGVVPAGTRLLDAGEPEHDGPAVRVLVVPSKDALALGAGGSPAPLQVAPLAWEFLRGGVGKPSAPAR